MRVIDFDATDAELEPYTQIGIKRDQDAKRKNRKRTNNQPAEQSLIDNIEGARGEWVYVASRGLEHEHPVHAGNKPGGPDFVIDGIAIDVKTTHWPNGNLILTPECSPEYLYVLITKRRPGLYRIWGQMPGAVAKHLQYFGDHNNNERPHYFIRRNLLDEVNYIDNVKRGFISKVKL